MVNVWRGKTFEGKTDEESGWNNTISKKEDEECVYK